MNRPKGFVPYLCISLLLAFSLASPANCWELNLDIPLHVYERYRWTGAASAQSVLEYYGISDSQCNIENGIKMRSDCCITNACDYLDEPAPVALASMFTQKGVGNYRLENVLSWAECVSNLNAGMPFIMKFDYWSDVDANLVRRSYETARGYDPTFNDIVYLDPSHGYMEASYFMLTSAPNVYESGFSTFLDWNATVVLTKSPAPACNMTGASSNSNTTATLTGTVNANTRATTVTTRLSTSPADQANNFSSYIESSPVSVSDMYNDESYIFTWTGLTPGTTYYYQIKAVSNGGTCLSVPGTFSTGAASAACNNVTNGQSLDTKPTANLCSVGSASTVTGTGPWAWTCSNGSSTVSCSAALRTYDFAVYVLSGGGTIIPSIGTISWDNGVIGYTGLYNYGTPVTFTAIPASGYAFNSWDSYGLASACDGTTNTCLAFAGVSSSAIFASFTPGKTLEVTKLGTGAGTITSTSPISPVINCGPTCSNSYALNTSVTLAATPNSGTIFTGWSGACSGTGSCVVNMNANQSVSATFTPSVRIVRTPTLNFASLQAAYDFAISGDIIQAQSTNLLGGLNANRDISVTIDGGYSSDYGTNLGVTLLGSTTISNGTVRMQNFQLQN